MCSYRSPMILAHSADTVTDGARGPGLPRRTSMRPTTANAVSAVLGPILGTIAHKWTEYQCKRLQRLVTTLEPF